MSKRHSSRLRVWTSVTAGVCALSLCTPSAGARGAQECPGLVDQLPLRFTAFAADVSGPAGGASAGTVDVVVQRWSTPDERQRLESTLAERGPDALLDVLRDMEPVGYIRTPGSLAYNLHYAQRAPLDEGGERLVLATDRPISFQEAARRPRTIDYPFTVIELRLDACGEGEGKMSFFTKVIYNRVTRTVELENYNTQPVMLLSVRPAS